jgi:hypothetical protein
MTPTLHLTRDGRLELLGQSQVFAYLLGLTLLHLVSGCERIG